MICACFQKYLGKNLWIYTMKKLCEQVEIVKLQYFYLWNGNSAAFCHWIMHLMISKIFTNRSHLVLPLSLNNTVKDYYTRSIFRKNHGRGGGKIKLILTENGLSFKTVTVFINIIDELNIRTYIHTKI